MSRYLDLLPEVASVDPARLTGVGVEAGGTGGAGGAA